MIQYLAMWWQDDSTLKMINESFHKYNIISCWVQSDTNPKYNRKYSESWLRDPSITRTFRHSFRHCFVVKKSEYCWLCRSTTFSHSHTHTTSQKSVIKSPLMFCFIINMGYGLLLSHANLLFTLALPFELSLSSSINYAIPMELNGTDMAFSILYMSLSQWTNLLEKTLCLESFIFLYLRVYCYMHVTIYVLFGA